MCVDMELSQRHNRRRRLDNKKRRSREGDKIKGVKPARHSRISVPLVIAAIAEDVIDALGPKKIFGSRLPRVVDTTIPVTKSEVSGLLVHRRERRRQEDEQSRQAYYERNPAAAAAAA